MAEHNRAEEKRTAHANFDIPVALDVDVYLVGNGADKWIAEVEIPSVGWRDGFPVNDYTDKDEAFNAAALMAIYRWRKNVGDAETPLFVNQIDLDAPDVPEEPAEKEA